MIDGKFFATLIGLVVAVFAVMKFTSGADVMEGFVGMPQRTAKVERLIGTKGCAANQFVSYPNMQSFLSPRFSNTQYGANITYSLPPKDYLAVNASNPLGYADAACSFSRVGPKKNVVEGYCHTCGDASCAPNCPKGGVGMQGGAPRNTQGLDGTTFCQEQGAFVPSSSAAEVGSYATDMLPVGDMTVVGADGDVRNPVVYDRLVFANQKSRLYGRGDPIRGDLPITPMCGQWFNVSAVPQQDLNPGAMAVMGGTMNQTANELYDLVHQYTGGYDDTVGGVGHIKERQLAAAQEVCSNPNWTTQKTGTIGADHGVEWTAFP